MINCSPHSWFPAPPCTLGTCPGRRGAERMDELVDHHQIDHDQRMVIIMIVMSMMLTCSTRPVGPSSHPATAIPPLLYSSVSDQDKSFCELIILVMYGIAVITMTVVIHKSMKIAFFIFLQTADYQTTRSLPRLKFNHSDLHDDASKFLGVNAL